MMLACLRRRDCCQEERHDRAAALDVVRQARVPHDLAKPLQRVGCASALLFDIAQRKCPRRAIGGCDAEKMQPGYRLKIRIWVGREIIPHEADLRARLRRSLDSDDVEDVIQEAYLRIARLDDVSHIRSGRAYLFATAKILVLERILRSRVVRIDTVTEIDSLSILEDEPSPERVAAGRQVLARIRRLIDGLPDRCRRIFELRKIEGLSQRQVSEAIGVPEHIVENDVAKGLKLILRAVEEGEKEAGATRPRFARTAHTKSGRQCVGLRRKTFRRSSYLWSKKHEESDRRCGRADRTSFTGWGAISFRTRRICVRGSGGWRCPKTRSATSCRTPI